MSRSGTCCSKNGEKEVIVNNKGQDNNYKQQEEYGVTKSTIMYCTKQSSDNLRT